MSIQENPIHYMEIVTPEVEGMCDLYAKSFGWNFQPASTELGNARVTELSDGSLFGIRAPMHSSEKPVVRIYVKVPDLDAAVKQVIQQGGKMMLERMEIPGKGIIAIYEFGGIEKGLWQVA